ncbi:MULTISPECIES: hemerythrin domain-containing protein [Catenuloplanes]|uniref:Hemerythrin-like domain-containing protein n=1 Tax=Catenuloplanes niger TaxID=587534 RepID=A0AAE4CRW4_9ACTN|nr:hemerythrin domain-containing protein [Catenuloplanes niger]MDR7322405.1 hemerythrin-like domain-containing protein [Catenuloplanes niger]
MSCEVHDMVLVHRVFRRELGAVPSYVRRVAEGDVRRAAVVADHLAMMLDVLHHHHETEDELLWPRLRARVPAADVELVDAMNAEHDTLARQIDAIGAALPRWRTSAAVPDGLRLIEAMDGFLITMGGHLDHEEKRALPLCAALIEQPEWNELGVAAMRAMGVDVWLLFVNAMREDASDEEWSEFLAALPPDAVESVNGPGRDAYLAYLGRLRDGGTAATA